MGGGVVVLDWTTDRSVFCVTLDGELASIRHVPRLLVRADLAIS